MTARSRVRVLTAMVGACLAAGAAYADPTQSPAHALAEKFAGGAERDAAKKKADEDKRRSAEEAEMLKRARIEAAERKAAADKARAEAEAAEARQEAERLAAEKRAAEEARIAQEKQAEAARRLADEQRIAREKFIADKIRAEEQRLADETRAEEERRVAEQTEAKRAEEQKRAEEEQRLAEQKRLEDERRQAEAKRAEEQKRAEEEQRLAEQKRLEDERRQAESKRAEEQKRADEEQRVAEERQKALEAEREAQHLRLTERLLQRERELAEQKRQENERRADEERQAEAQRKTAEEKRRAETTEQALTEPPRMGLGGPQPAALHIPPHPVAPSAAPTRVTVLLAMDVGGTGIRRFGKKTADPVLCSGAKCWISAGSDRPSRLMARGQALGPGNTLGPRAAACNQHLVCVFRDIDLKAVTGDMQPIDLRIMRHDRREPKAIEADTSCRVSNGALVCDRIFASRSWKAWIVPEHVAAAAGGRILENALAAGLPMKLQPSTALAAPLQ